MLPSVQFAIVALSTRAQFYSDVGGAIMPISNLINHQAYILIQSTYGSQCKESSFSTCENLKYKCQQ